MADEEVFRRLKTLEERYNGMDRKTEVIENNMLDNFKKLTSELKTVNSEFLEVKRQLAKIEDDMLLIVKELRLSAKKDELDTLKKYIDLWNPVDFVRRREIGKMLQEKAVQQ